MLSKLFKCLQQTSFIGLILAIIVVESAGAQIKVQNFSNVLFKSSSSESSRVSESNGTIVILPPAYDEKETYPALVLLPSTGGRPIDYFRGPFAERYQSRNDNPYILILPDIQSNESAYSSGEAWLATIEQYEKLVGSNLDFLIPKYNIDSSRIVIGGYSLGGDLSWALSLRNPSVFRGVIAVGSQSNIRNDLNMPKLAVNDSRFFMIMGEEDWRLQRMRLAVDELARYNITHRFEIIPNADHYTIFNQYPVGEIFTEAIDFILFDEM
ncbi:dienelactone hydrolase family protein [Leptothoe sp. EHU-05/26/07-4]